MQWDDLYIGATGVWIPPLRAAADAVAAGEYDAEECAENGYESVAISQDESAAEMAVAAAREAVYRAAMHPSEYGLCLYAGFYHSGIDYWTPASYVQRMALGGSAPAIEIGQASNGGMAALELAAAHLTADRGHSAALIATADRYCPPGFDRYRTERGVLFADGATAAVLRRGHGAFQLLSTAHVSVPELEEIYRGDGFTTHPLAEGMPLDVRARSGAYLSKIDIMQVMGTMAGAVREAVDSALQQAGGCLDDLAAIVPPNLGLPSMTWQFFEALKLDETRTTYPWGRRVGHMGAGDQLGGLHRLIEESRVPAGGRVMLLGSGIGFTWSAAVLEAV